MNYADFFTQPNGFPLESDATLGFMQTDYQSAIVGLAKAIGANGLILSGVVESGGSVSEGWILWDGDVVRFEAGVVSTNFIIVTAVTQKANENGTLVDRYTVKTARFGTGPGEVAFSTLRRVQSLEQLVSRITAIAGLEDAVILKGCVVTNVETGPSTCDISAGQVLMDGLYLDVPAYSGQYPVYLQLNGEYSLVIPDDTHIKFDPYTSQYYADVVTRATTKPGRILIQKTTSDRFDGAGLGRWEMKGFALCNSANSTRDMRGRFPVGYDGRAVDPGGGVWHPDYFVPGTAGGAKDVTLNISQMPSHNHTGNGGSNIDGGEFGLVRKTVIGEGRTASGVDATNNEPDVMTSPIDIPLEGGGASHENRPPYVVVVYIERI